MNIANLITTTQLELHPSQYEELKPYLSNSCHELIHALGLEDAFNLINRFMGTSIQILSRDKGRKESYQNLCNLVGSKHVVDKLLIQYSGMRRIYIPKEINAFNYIRNKEIIKEYEALLSNGLTGKDSEMALAHKYNLSERRIRTIVNGGEKKDDPRFKTIAKFNSYEEACECVDNLTKGNGDLYRYFICRRFSGFVVYKVTSTYQPKQ